MSCPEHIDTSPCIDLKCPILFLPTEILHHIFSYLNTDDIISCSGTCKHWYNIISYSESLWKLQCLNLDSTDLPGQLKQLSGQTWKEIFQQNYSINRIKNLWKQGTFSNPKSYKELPSQRFCKLDTDSWGQIFEWELDRS